MLHLSGSAHYKYLKGCAYRLCLEASCLCRRERVNAGGGSIGGGGIKQLSAFQADLHLSAGTVCLASGADKPRETVELYGALSRCVARKLTDR